MKLTILRVLCIFCICSLFIGCASKPVNDPTTNSTVENQAGTSQTDEHSILPDGTPLSQQELQWFNDQFFSSEWTDSEGKPIFNLRNMFLRVTFTTAAEIDLGVLFREGTGQDAVVTQQEIDALNQKLGNNDPLDVVKIPEAAMKSSFLEKTGLSIEQTQQLGIDKLTYLEEYKAYYHKHSDTAYTLWQMEDGVKLNDGSVVLLYAQKLGSVQTKQVVTLKPHEDSYWFVSNLPAQ